MDLRNRDNYQQIVKELTAVPSERYMQLSKVIDQIAERDAHIEKEAVSLSRSLEEKSALARMAQVGTSQGTMRIHVFSSRNEPKKTYSLRISSGEQSYRMQSTLSDFVSRVEIKLPSGETVAWARSADEGSPAVDGISVSRPLKDSEAHSADILIHVNYKNCLYPVPPALSNKTNGGFMSFVQLFRCICAYIKSHNLSSNDDPSYFTPDKVLHEILYPNHPMDIPVSFASLLEAIRSHFKVPGPFKITHQVGQQEQIFDLVVQLHDNVDTTTSETLSDAERKLSQKLQELDADIAAVTDGLSDVSLDAQFLDKLASNPALYLQQILASPTGEKREIKSDGFIDYLQMATSFDFYKQPWAVAAAAYVVSEQRKHAT